MWTDCRVASAGTTPFLAGREGSKGLLLSLFSSSSFFLPSSFPLSAVISCPLCSCPPSRIPRYNRSKNRLSSVVALERTDL